MEKKRGVGGFQKSSNVLKDFSEADIVEYDDKVSLTKLKRYIEKAYCQCNWQRILQKLLLCFSIQTSQRIWTIQIVTDFKSEANDFKSKPNISSKNQRF